jgi:lipopolysaccharide biosynthesis protein
MPSVPRRALDHLLDFSLTHPDRLVEPDAWVGHIPFAFWIIAAHRPRVLVELGTHSGNSYAAFCQGVTALGLETKCYAVDTWAGDPQAGFYGEEIYEELRRYHDARYAAFSRLVRSTFDEAANHFPNNSIDLLHIDGYHIYDAVKHDFETWAPKLSQRGIVLFHDINVRERDFGAWKLWQELSADLPSFAFHHSHGLGVLGVGRELGQPVLDLLRATDQQAVAQRRWFTAAARSIRGELELARADHTARQRAELEQALNGLVQERASLEAEAVAARNALAVLEADLTASESRHQQALAELERRHQQSLAMQERRHEHIRAKLEKSEQEHELVLAQVQKLHADRALLLDTRAFLKRQLDKERRRRRRLRSSLSWKATKPFRLVGTAFKRLAAGLPYASMARKHPPEAVPAPMPETAQEVVPSLAPTTYVKLVEANPLRDPIAKLVAFYLPQFHPIPENDAWWGKGFTEWTNVTKAEPQFAGHYQPHLPGELGFYDLRLSCIQQRQVELARTYGISAFCFYFYWFAGKRLLEQPLDQYLHNGAFGLDFCICWANENWTRRWDGMESEILIGQQHSADDDLEFIAYVAKYLRDPRYLRVRGRPVLLVYRPQLLPDPKATAARWRSWCQSNGIGEIYLIETLAFERTPPADLGFDAATEFPPLNMWPPPIPEISKNLRGAPFEGQVLDGTAFGRSEQDFTFEVTYPLFRGVCPSWDNTARRGPAATILAGTSPPSYRDWLTDAVTDTARRFGDPDERLVFVNAWNEWAEGAHLEPDRRYGYAFLEATRQGLRHAARRVAAPPRHDAPLAVALHAFYPELLDEILPLLQAADLTQAVFVTCSEQGHAHVEAALNKNGVRATLTVVPNRGRDIAPFLQTLAQIDCAGYELLLKIHTKKSPHLLNGASWRVQLLNNLLDPDASRVAIAGLCGAGGYGVVGPADHMLSMGGYQGSNNALISQLTEKLGVASLDLTKDVFVAGSMYFARTDALRPLMVLGLTHEHFEPEAGQLDGTLAHTVERLTTYSALAAGYRIGAVSGDPPRFQPAVPREGVYPFLPTLD